MHPILNLILIRVMWDCRIWGILEHSFGCFHDLGTVEWALENNSVHWMRGSVTPRACVLTPVLSHYVTDSSEPSVLPGGMYWPASRKVLSVSPGRLLGDRLGSYGFCLIRQRREQLDTCSSLQWLSVQDLCTSCFPLLSGVIWYPAWWLLGKLPDLTPRDSSIREILPKEDPLSPWPHLGFL